MVIIETKKERKKERDTKDLMFDRISLYFLMNQVHFIQVCTYRLVIIN